MKKFILIILSIILFSGCSLAKEEEEFQPVVVEQEKPTKFFKSSLESLDEKMERDFGTDINYMFEENSKVYKEIQGSDMPLFKKYRLFLREKWRELSFNEPEKPKVYDEETGELIDDDDNDEVEKVPFWSRFKRKPKQEPEQQNLTGLDDALINSIQDETSEKKEEKDVISFETGISKHITEKELMLDADNVTYDDETGDMVATGRPLLYLPPQRTKVVADEMTYNQDSNILKGSGNVVITKDGNPTHADNIEVDINEETIIANKVSSQANSFTVDSEKAVHQNDLLVLTNGNIHSDKSHIYMMSSRMIGPRFSSMVLEDDEKSSFFMNDVKGNQVNINIDKIRVEALKNHDKFSAKKIEIFRKGKHWITWPGITVYTDKEREYLEASYPEFGSKRKLGQFFGPGFAFGGPAGSVIKVIPFINYQKGDFGFGGALKYHNRFNYTELGYGSASEIFFMRGLQRLDDNLYLQYSANSYMDEWFLGRRMPKYMAEVFYDKSYPLANFLGEDKPLLFRHRVGFGLMEDNDRNYYGEKINGTGMSTTRLRYQAQIAQSLYRYANPDKRFYVDLNIVMQGSAAVYGNGDTQFIGRIGPGASIQYKNWKQDIAYLQTGYQDNSPMPRYDAYRYGNSSVRLSEILRINKYLSVGWTGTVVLSNDTYNGKMFQENRFAIAVGPDDLKLRLGYDFVRRSTFFGFDVAFDSKGTNINYKRMEIKNPERLGKVEKGEDRKLAFIAAKQKERERQQAEAEKKALMLFNRPESKTNKVILEYAQVTNIEDPDKETVE